MTVALAGLRASWVRAGKSPPREASRDRPPDPRVPVHPALLRPRHDCGRGQGMRPATQTDSKGARAASLSGRPATPLSSSRRPVPCCSRALVTRATTHHHRRDRGEDALPVVSRSARPRGRRPDGFAPAANGPGMPAPGRALPRPVHAPQPARPPGRTRLVDHLVPRRRPGGRGRPARRARRGPRPGSAWSLRARGGARRGAAPRHTLTNTGAWTTLWTASRWCCRSRTTTRGARLHRRDERERSPQRHAITDGLWLREGRAGRPHSTRDHGRRRHGRILLRHGRVFGVHVGWSGNSVRRSSATSGRRHDPRRRAAAARRGRAANGESYASPWVCFAAADRAWTAWPRDCTRTARPRRAPDEPSRWCGTCGRRCTSTTTSGG